MTNYSGPVPAVSFRLSPEDFHLWKKMANDQGLTEGTAAKQLILKTLRATQKGENKMTEEKKGYPEKTEEVLAKAFLSQYEGDDQDNDQEKTEQTADDDGIVFIEEPYIGERDSKDFRELNNMDDDDDLWNDGVIDEEQNEGWRLANG